MKTIRRHSINSCILLLSIITLSCHHHMPVGIYEFKSINAEWLRINIKSDSTFLLQDYTANRLDSAYTIDHMSGRWKMKGSKLYLYEPYDPNFDSVYDYKFFLNNKWKYQKKRIYSKGNEIVKLYFTRIK